MTRTRTFAAALAGLATFSYAGVVTADEIPATSLEVGDKGCTPMRLSVKPGKTTFQVKNVSARKIEWEILNGVNVVEERENIVPGFTVRVTAKLEAGEYLMTCGLLNNPKGSLTVVRD